MNDSNSKPDGYRDPAGKHRPMTAPSGMTIKWNNSANADEKLERIMIQNAANNGITTVPNRLPFSYNEYLNNKGNMDKAVSLLGGDDNFATKLWWQKK